MLVPPYGPLDAKIAIVGEAPGKMEELQGIPFVGSSGHLLDNMLMATGIDRKACRLYNIMDIRPSGNDFGIFYEDKKRSNPSPALVASIKILKQRLLEHNPNVIVALGAEPLKALTGKIGINKWRGSVLKTDIQRPDGSFIKILPTFHPAGILRLYVNRAIGELDLRRVVKEAEFPEIVKKERTFKLDPSFTDVMDFLRSYHKRLSFDIETTDLLIRCVGFAWSDTEAICIPFMSNRYGQKKGSQFLLVPSGSPKINNHWTLEEEFQIIKAMKSLLENPNVEKIAQNFPFDATVLGREFGIIVRGLYMDTMRAHHCCYSELPKSLDFLTSIYTDMGYYADKDTSVDMEEWIYNCKDSVVTFEVADLIEQEARELGVWGFYKHFVEPEMYALSQAGNRGAPIDLKLRDQLATDEKARLVTIKEELSKKAGFELNPNSSKQMHQFLYTTLKIPPIRHRKTKKITANEEAIERLVLKYPRYAPLLEDCLDYRGTVKLISTFLESELNEFGRMETNYDASGTKNGRISSSTTLSGLGGNLQQIPRDGTVRSMYYAPEGYLWIKADLAQAEARAVAWFGRIPELIERFLHNPNFDIHTWVASLMHRKAESLVSKEERQIAKVGPHGGNYGIGAAAVARIMKVPYAIAKDALAQYKGALPRLEKWWEEIKQEVVESRKLRTPFGRQRIFFDRFEDELFRSARAFKPQSLVGDIINRAFTILELWIDFITPVLQVHDEIDCICLEADLERSVRVIKNVMEYSVQIEGVKEPLLIPCDISVGKNWKDVVSYKKWKEKQLEQLTIESTT